MRKFRRQGWRIVAVAAVWAGAACAGDDGADAGAMSDAEMGSGMPNVEVSAPAPNAAVQTELTPDPGGEIIEVRMVMPGGQNPAYEPTTITAQRGDVLRFINVENVHNVHFPSNGNPAGVDYPPAGPILTQPGQTYDFKVEFPNGTYRFICDPHLALGMVGDLIVTD